MADTQEIDKAIGAHGMWKTRLKMAIDTGKVDAPVETIRTDNQCAFGKWLYGTTLTATDKASPDYKNVKTLHAEFHKAAASVAELVLAGKKAEAEKLMSFTGVFTLASTNLTAAMMEWKKKSK
ncbi:MAG: CZB domain-containing protein [Gammaproteobacteria bacterium]|nr:CZB domain-containing protein [Gammaproteobacteria bacterium]